MFLGRRLNPSRLSLSLHQNLNVTLNQYRVACSIRFYILYSPVLYIFYVWFYSPEERGVMLRFTAENELADFVSFCCELILSLNIWTNVWLYHWTPKIKI